MKSTMNAKVAIAVIALLAVGLLMVLLFQINQPAVLTTSTSRTQTITTSPKKAEGEAPTLAHGFVMQTYAAFTPAVTPSPTPYPRSYARVTIAVSASATELQVGDIVTLTAVVTNTGKLKLDKVSCNPEIYLEDGTTQERSGKPLILQRLSGGGYLPGRYVLHVGSSGVATFTLQALNSGTAIVRIGGSALTKFSPAWSESWVALDDAPHPTTITIHVNSARP